MQSPSPAGASGEFSVTPSSLLQFGHPFWNRLPVNNKIQEMQLVNYKKDEFLLVVSTVMESMSASVTDGDYGGFGMCLCVIKSEEQTEENTIYWKRIKDLLKRKTSCDPMSFCNQCRSYICARCDIHSWHVYHQKPERRVFGSPKFLFLFFLKDLFPTFIDPTTTPPIQ